MGTISTCICLFNSQAAYLLCLQVTVHAYPYFFPIYTQYIYMIDQTVNHLRQQYFRLNIRVQCKLSTICRMAASGNPCQRGNVIYIMRRGSCSYIA